MNADFLLGVSRPSSAEVADKMLSPEELFELPEKKRDASREGSALQPVSLKRGSLDTSFGQLVSKDEGIQMIKAQDEANRVRTAERAAKEAQEHLAFEEQRAHKRADRATFEFWALKRRISAYGDPDVTPRPLKLRAAAAKERTRMKRFTSAARSNSESQ